MKKQLLLTFLLALQSIFFYSQQRLDRITIPSEDAEVQYIYDANNLHIESNFYYEGDIDSKTSITYNSDDNPTLIISTYFDGTYFINEEKYEYTYNVDSQLEEVLYYFWDESENNWIYEDKTTFQYNIDGFLETTNNYYPDNSLYGISNYIYDSSNKLIRIEYHDNNDIITDKDEYTYDANGNLLTLIETIDEDNDGIFTNDYKYELTTYDNSVSNSDLILPIFTEVYADREIWFNHKLTNMTEYYEPDGNGDFLYSVDYIFHYTNVASTEDINTITVNVKPNPFSDTISFDIPNNNNFSITLFDIQGKLVKTATSKTINTSNLSNGVYIYKIQMDNQFSIGKIIKK